MEKTKKIILALSISLVLVLVINGIVINYKNSKYIEIPIFAIDALKGKKITKKDIQYIQVKDTDENKLLLQTVLNENFNGGVLAQNVSKGELAINEKIMSKQDILVNDVNYNYISIPVSDLSYPTCNRLSRGDRVTIYYTAKIKDVSNAIKDKARLYSNNEKEGFVTCLLFDDVEVISLHDNTGKEAKENIVTDVLIRLSKQDAMLIANLKSQGTFDIVLN